MAILDPTNFPTKGGGGSMEYGLNIQRGLVEGVGVTHIFGRNPDIEMNTFEDIWNGGGDYTGFNATTAQTVSLVSTSTQDSAAGTGARTIQLVGLDATYNTAIEIVTLNGTTPILSTNSYIRCHTARILTAGSNAANLGVVTGRQSTTTANVFFAIPVGDNRSLLGQYTAPADTLSYVTGAFATLSKKNNTNSEIKISVRFPNGVFQVVEWFSLSGSGSSYIYRDFEVPLIGVPTGTDIRIQADASANGTGVSAGLEILTVSTLT